MRRTALLALCLLSGLLVAGTLGPAPATGGGGPPAVIADWEGVSTGTGNDDDAKLLLHFESDTATPWSDSSLAAHAQPTISTATRSEVQEKFGDSSGLFVAASNQYLSYAAHEDWDLSAGDFTIDMQVRFVSLPAAGSNTKLACHYHDNNNQTVFGLINTAGTYYLRFFLYNGGGYDLQMLRAATLVVDTWYHVAVTRDGNDYRIFLDGTQLGAEETDVDGPQSMTAVLNIGACNVGFSHHDGYIDELRWSPGIARWTAGFTAPTAKYGGLTLWLEDSEGNKYPAQGWVP